MPVNSVLQLPLWLINLPARRDLKWPPTPSSETGLSLHFDQTKQNVRGLLLHPPAEGDCLSSLFSFISRVQLKSSLLPNYSTGIAGSCSLSVITFYLFKDCYLVPHLSCFFPTCINQILWMHSQAVLIDSVIILLFFSGLSINCFF